jgi:hypothetical protein
MFEDPTFTVWNVIYTAAAAAILWGTWGETKLRVFGLSKIVDLIPVSGRVREGAELLLFVLLGCIVGIGVAKPHNPAQAISAGLAWTGAFARPDLKGATAGGRQSRPKR